MKISAILRAVLRSVITMLSCLPLSHGFEVSGDVWPGATTTFYVDLPSEDGLWNDAFEDAAQAWNDATPYFHFDVVRGVFKDPCDDPKHVTPKNGVKFSDSVCGVAFGAYVLAVEMTWVVNEGKTSLQSGIWIDSHNYWNVYSGPTATGEDGIYDLRRVLIHELGHSLGLWHEEDVPSIMRFIVSDLEAPTDDDKAGVAYLYEKPVPVGADLVVTDLTVAPATAQVRVPITVRFKVRNIGNVLAGPSTTNVRLAESASNVTTEDALLFSVDLPQIPAGGWVTLDHTEGVPTTSPGDYHLWVIADIDSTAGQSDETNDRTHIPFAVTESAKILEFDPIGADQVEGQPFPVTINAVDDSGQSLAVNATVQLYSVSAAVTVEPTSVQLVDGSWSGFVTVEGSGARITLTGFGSGTAGSSSAFSVTGPGAHAAHLSGVVSDFTGSPLAGAKVYLTPGGVEPGASTLDTVTDGNGHYAFGPIDADSYDLWAEYDGGIARRSSTSFFSLSSFGPQTRNIKINVYPSGIPVLLVPGILGSTKTTDRGFIPFLPRQYPAKKEDLRLLDPLDLVGWDNLKDELTACGFSEHSIYSVPYDWRAPVKDVAEKYLKPAIDLAKMETGSDKVYIVAHSTGGLAARYYIQYVQQQDSGGDVAKLAMVGTPHQGSVNAYYIWAGGRPKQVDDLVSSGIWWGNYYSNSIEVLYEDTYKLGNLDINNPATVYNFLRSARSGADQVGAELHDLLPTFDFLYSSWVGGPDWGLASSDNRNTTLQTLNADPKLISRMTRNGAGDTVQTAVFYSQSEDTIRRHGTVPESLWSVQAPRFADGVPWKSSPKWAKGDGTVLDFSAQLPYTEGWAQAYAIAGSHSRLVNSAKTRIREFLAADHIVCSAAVTAQTASAAAELPASELSVGIQGRVRPYLVSPGGANSGVHPSTGLLENEIANAAVSLDAQDSTIRVVDPADGVYIVSISGVAEGEVDIRLNFLTEIAFHTKRVRLFHHGDTSTFTFRIDGSTAEPLTVGRLPAPPVNTRAIAVGEANWTTRIAWEASPTIGVIGYHIYGRRPDEPFMTLRGTTNGLAFDTLEPWAGEGGAPTLIYAVSALLSDGTESFLSDYVENDDRDHDGLRDSAEAQHGTNPDLWDTDNDGLSDGEEVAAGTVPVFADTDEDGFPDGDDAFPLDETELRDTDSDGIGNNSDPDDDNDTIADADDPYPIDSSLPGSSDVISVKPELNLIAYLRETSEEHATCQGLVESLGGAAVIASFKRFDPVRQAFENCGSEGSANFAIISGEGYLADVYSSKELRLAGGDICPELTLAAGLNLRGHPDPPPGFSCYQWLDDLGASAVSTIRRFDRATGRFQGCAFQSAGDVQLPAGEDFPIVPGEGYLLFSRSGGAVASLICGGAD